MTELYVFKDGKNLRCGYTTGSCAAGAAKAAVMMLFTRTIPEYVDIETPAGINLKLKIEKPVLTETSASCCIIKDAGDDPDVTDGMEIYAKVTKRQDTEITIDGGLGIGRIKREGFLGKLNEAAINPVPRKMIKDEILKVTNKGVEVVIYAPLGVEIAKKTFNSNIGIEGGISIIGTKGIVEPMSEEALKKTIYLEIDELYYRGVKEILLYPGNYGEGVIKEKGISCEKVKVSNFIGDAVQYCYAKGFEKIIVLGHIGKLCKVSIGAFNTHSRICDIRIEAFIYYLAIAKAPYEIIEKVSTAVTSEEALKTIIENGYNSVIDSMKKGVIRQLKKYIKDDNFNIDVIMYSMNYGIL